MSELATPESALVASPKTKRRMMRSLTMPSDGANVPLPSRWIPVPDIPIWPVLSPSALLSRPKPLAPSILDAGNSVYVLAGRVAIGLALRLAGLVEGDKVLLPAFHCTSMVEPLVCVSASPVFYRVNTDLSVDIEDIARKIDASTRALITTNYFGFPQNLQMLRSFCDDNDLIAGAGCSDDGNECTDDVCDGFGACTHPNATDGTPCTGNGVGECTEADTCLGGTCEDNDQPLDTECDLDGDQCTLDFCDAVGLCVFDSEVSCPKGEVCIGGQCVAGCSLCPTDVTGDGDTGAADLASLLACWGPVVAGCECFDANGDGIIGPADLATLLAAWGPCP